MQPNVFHRNCTIPKNCKNLRILTFLKNFLFGPVEIVSPILHRFDSFSINRNSNVGVSAEKDFKLIYIDSRLDQSGVALSAEKPIRARQSINLKSSLILSIESRREKIRASLDSLKTKLIKLLKTINI